MNEIIQEFIHLLLHGSKWSYNLEKINGIWFDVHKCKIEGCKFTRYFKEY